MLTNEQEKDICLLHSAISLDSLFEISPISRFDMSAEVKASPDQLFAMQMLHAHFQNFVSDHFSSYAEGMRLAESTNQQLVKNKIYRSRIVLRSTIIDCISRLLGPNPKCETEMEHFVFGYSTYILSQTTRKAIGDWFMSKDRSLYFLWYL